MERRLGRSSRTRRNTSLAPPSSRRAPCSCRATTATCTRSGSCLGRARRPRSNRRSCSTSSPSGAPSESSRWSSSSSRCSSTGGPAVAPRLTERAQAVLFAAVLMTAIAGLTGTAILLQPAPVSVHAVGSVRLDVEGAGWSIRYTPTATNNNTVFGLLLEASAKFGFTVAYITYQIPQGVFVTAINGSMNGDGGRYWQYWVNGAYGTVAADHAALHDHDVVLWNFSASVEGL
ncbi:MAG: DUF4430 domain-containing protein [Methanobacteriota archaeon]|nr:MAG: DUF4430 domain-containing protein [Euryarchaeota archaeon]